MDISLWALAALVLGLFLLLFLGMEIGFAIGLVGICGLIFILDFPLIEPMIGAWVLTNSFALSAIPLFIFMGYILLSSGISERLFRGADNWLGGLPGGLCCSVVGACAMFAAMSGSSQATAGTIGAVSLPEMESRRYNMRLACGTLAAGGTLGILIPPSITMIIYGSWMNVAVGKLFMAGVVPGVMLAGIYILGISLVCLWRPNFAPRGKSTTWRNKVNSLPDLLPTIILIVVILGGIFIGIWDPTEGAAVGSFASIILALAYRQLTINSIKQAALGSVRVTSMLILVMVGAQIVAFIMQYTGVTTTVANAMLSLSSIKWVIMILIFVLYLILGCFFDAVSMMLLTLPFVFPVVSGLGYSPIWFGVVLVICIEAGMITPPVGLNLYVINTISRGKYSVMGVIAAGAAPFLIGMFIELAILLRFPSIALWLPGMM